MERNVEAIETTIPKGRTLRIRDGRGVELQPIEGCIWVTYENDTADVVVEAGDTLRVARNGATLVHAFKTARVRIAHPADAGAPSMTFGGGYREVGAGIFAAMLTGWARGLRDRFAVAVAARGRSDVNARSPA